MLFRNVYIIHSWMIRILENNSILVTPLHHTEAVIRWVNSCQASLLELGYKVCPARQNHTVVHQYLALSISDCASSSHSYSIFLLQPTSLLLSSEIFSLSFINRNTKHLSLNCLCLSLLWLDQMRKLIVCIGPRSVLEFLLISLAIVVLWSASLPPGLDKRNNSILGKKSNCLCNNKKGQSNVSTRILKYSYYCFSRID